MNVATKMIVVCGVGLLLCLLTNQGYAVQSQSDSQVEEFADRYEKMFAPRDPKVGTMVADVSGFDESGKPFPLSETRGKHTVLVFGCLT